MKSPELLLEEAKRLAPKDSLAGYVETIKALREKNFSWRDIAEFLQKHGINTDHTKVFRYMKALKDQGNTGTDFFVPTAVQYANALKEIVMTEKQKAMLLFHYRAHNRTVTYTELARTAGFDDYKRANLQYGKLGRALGEELDMNFAVSAKTGDLFYSSAIGADNPFKPTETDYELVMHHELAKAIDALGWAAND
jgi:hypothetical protein